MRKIVIKRVGGYDPAKGRANVDPTLEGNVRGASAAPSRDALYRNAHRPPGAPCDGSCGVCLAYSIDEAMTKAGEDQARALEKGAKMTLAEVAVVTLLKAKARAAAAKAAYADATRAATDARAAARAADNAAWAANADADAAYVVATKANRAVSEAEAAMRGKVRS